MTRSVNRWLLAGTCAYGALAAGTAFAQTATPTAANPTPAAEQAQAEGGAPPPSSEIVVTGSRIQRPDYVATSPIISISQDTFQNTGRVTLERSLSQLPQFSGSFGAANAGSTSTGLNGGQSYASLRGLGPKRTLILLDGRRLQPSNPDGSVDLNIIPEALIENVEVITGGASTTYGSDATAGVVNFRLRRNFTGLEINSNYGFSDYGDGQQFKVSGSYGKNFAEDRGNAVFSLDYTKRGRAYQYKRPSYFLARTPTQAGTSTLPEGNVLFGSNTPTIAAVNGVFAKYGFANAFSGTGAVPRYTGQIGFNQDGTVFSNLTTRVLNFRDPQTDLAYIATTGANSQQVNFGYPDSSIQADLKRYNAFGRIEYKITDSIKAFVQGSYTNYTSVGVSNPTLASNVYALAAPVTNPFIPADFRTILASRAAPNADMILYKAFNLAGPRYQGYKYEVWQGIAGLSGNLGIKDWTWDVYGAISRAHFENSQTGGVSASATRTLLYAADGGRSICSGGLNLFGDFTPSQQCIDYVKRRTVNTNTLKQRTVEGNVQGGLFNWWGGEVRFAAGADYRYNSYKFVSDPGFNQNGASDILGYSVLLPASGAVNTKEVYGELLVPLVQDLPFIKKMSLDLGYRYSNYNSVGSVNTYKITGDWEVVREVRFRGGWNRAIRAPSVGELYAPVSTASVGIGTASATNVLGDPCDVRSSFRLGANGAQVRNLCLSQGVPGGIIDTYQLGTAQVFALNGGNPDLEEESADTYSAGVVLSSPFRTPLLSRISISVDAYKIKINKAIGPLSIAQGIQNCFNAGGNNTTYSASNYYCSLIGPRNASTGVPINPTQPLLNLGQYTVQGVDFQLDWRFNLRDAGLPDIGSFAFNTAITYLDKFKIQALPGGVTYDYAGAIGSGGQIDATSGLAHPKWKTVTSGTYSIGIFSAGVVWRFMDKMKDASLVVTPTSTTPGVPKYNVFDFNARVMTPLGLELRAGVTNAFNKKPPIVGGQLNSFDSQDYDILGRYWFFGITQKF